MKARKGKAVWQGKGKSGNGHLSTESLALDKMDYSFHSRFEDGKGTNPEELIAAAHSGCFTMQLNFLLAEEGFDPTKIESECTIKMEDGKIRSSHMDVQGFVKGIDHQRFEEIVNKALDICPVSKVLNAEKSVRLTLNQASQSA